MSDTTWPTHGPDFNSWNSDFDRFAALLHSVKDEPWWIWDTDLKYLNVRIDTRDNGFLLFTDDKTDGAKRDRISPDRVRAAIEKYLDKYPSRRSLLGEIFDAGTPDDVRREADRIFDKANLIDCVKDARSQFPIVAAIARAIMAGRAALLDEKGWKK